MTIVRVRFNPPTGPIPGRIRFAARHDEGNRPLVSGRDIINGDTGWIDVPVGGAEIEVRPSESGWHYAIQGKADGLPAFNDTRLVPPVGPVDFESLVRYDPKAGMPYEPDPDWWAHVNGIEYGLEGVQADLHTARDLAATSANGAAASATTAVNARNDAQTARDQTLANALTVDTSAGVRVMTGSRVIFYESGVRDIRALINPNWTANRIELSRHGAVVTLHTWHLSRTNTTNGDFLTLPIGFRPAGNVFARFIGSGDPIMLIRRWDTAPTQIQGTAASIGNTSNGQTFSWTTPDAPPTTLPGVPA